MSHPLHRPVVRRPGQLRRLHRLAGLASAVGVLWLALTGLPLFLADSLGLARMAAPAFIQHSLYGLAVNPERGVTVDTHRVAEPRPGTWTFDGRALGSSAGTLMAVVPGDPAWFIVGSAGIVLSDDAGQVIDHVDAAFIRLGRLVAAGPAPSGNGACVRDDASRVLCSRDGLQWTAADASGVRWGDSAGPAGDGNEVPAITVERVLQDLHTLRFLGRLGSVLGLVFGLAMVLLAITGLITALAPKRARRQPGASRR